MKINIIQLLFCISISIILSSCNDDILVENNKLPKDVIFPLDTSNKWIIKISNPDSLAQFIITTNYIAKDTLIENEIWFKSNTQYVFGVDLKFIRNSKNGLLEYDTYLNKESILLKYPANNGEVYNYFGGSIKVVSINDTIVTPAGKFVCYHYEIGLLDAWYSPNVGLVRQKEYVGFTNARKLVGITELLDYSVK